MFFRNNYFGSKPSLISCFFNKFFLHLSVIAVVCYLLTVWDPANIYLFKLNSRNSRKRCEMCPELTINTAESRSGVLLSTLNIFHTFLSVIIVDFE